MCRRRLNLIGKKFGRLTVVGFSHMRNKRTCWLCECSCGNKKVVRNSDLTSGDTKSCGCLNLEEMRKRMTGDNHYNWKNGNITRSGYAICLFPEHPRADDRGYVLEHLLVAEGERGAQLEKNAVIHHIDGNRKNNDPKNLFIFRSNGAHMRFEFFCKRHALNKSLILESNLNT
jgi:hypothetical protein